MAVNSLKELNFTGIECEAPGNPVNGVVSSITEHSDGRGNIPYGTIVNFHCDIGYGMVGSETITCEGDGQSTVGILIPDPPSCEGRL